MKFYKLLPAFLFVLLLTACGSKKKAFQFSEDIVKMETELTPEIEKTETEVEQAIEKGDNDAVIKSSSRMEGLIDAKIKDIEGRSVKGISRGEEFKKACLHYFEYMKNIYTSYRKYGEATTEEAKQKVAEDMVRIVNGKNQEVTNLQNEQREFAKENGFRIK